MYYFCAAITTSYLNMERMVASDLQEAAPLLSDLALQTRKSSSD